MTARRSSSIDTQSCGSSPCSSLAGSDRLLTRRRFLALTTALTLGGLIGQAGASPAAPEPDEDFIAPLREEHPSAKNRTADGIDPNEHRLFLTFDDGPLHCTGQILDLLASTGHKATFFVIGKNLAAPTLREFAVRALQEGHEIGNHSYNHPDFSTISAQRAREEITSTHALVKEVVEQANVAISPQNRYFRFPYGVEGSRKNIEAIREVLAELSYGTAWWDVDTKDWCMEAAWMQHSPAAVVAQVRRARALDVVLLHDRNATARHLPDMLKTIEVHKLVSVPLSRYTAGTPGTPGEHPAGEGPPPVVPSDLPDSDSLAAQLLEGLGPGTDDGTWIREWLSGRSLRADSELW